MHPFEVSLFVWIYLKFYYIKLCYIICYIININMLASISHTLTYFYMAVPVVLSIKIKFDYFFSFCIQVFWIIKKCHFLVKILFWFFFFVFFLVTQPLHLWFDLDILSLNTLFDMRLIFLISRRWWIQVRWCTFIRIRCWRRIWANQWWWTRWNSGRWCWKEGRPAGWGEDAR